MKERIYGQVMPDVELLPLSKKRANRSPEKSQNIIKIEKLVQIINDENINT
jgi:hypothetical protein